MRQCLKHLLVLSMSNPGSSVCSLLPKELQFRRWLRGLCRAAKAHRPALVWDCTMGASRGCTWDHLVQALGSLLVRSWESLSWTGDELSILLETVPCLGLVKIQSRCWQTWLRAWELHFPQPVRPLFPCLCFSPFPPI